VRIKKTLKTQVVSMSNCCYAVTGIVIIIGVKMAIDKNILTSFSIKRFNGCMAYLGRIRLLADITNILSIEAYLSVPAVSAGK